MIDFRAIFPLRILLLLVIRFAPALFLFLFLLFPGRSQAQDTNLAVTTLWVDFDANWLFKNGITFENDIGARTSVASDDFSQIYYRPSINFDIGVYLEAFVGFSIWYSDQKSTGKLLELRPWQGVMLDWPQFGRFHFSHYLRFEERFQYLFDEESWSDHYRARYRLSLTAPINNTGIVDNTWSVTIHSEFFQNITGNSTERYINKNRYGINLGYRYNHNWRLQLRYMLDNARTDVGEDFALNDNIFNLTARYFFESGE